MQLFNWQTKTRPLPCVFRLNPKLNGETVSQTHTQTTLLSTARPKNSRHTRCHSRAPSVHTVSGRQDVVLVEDRAAAVEEQTAQVHQHSTLQRKKESKKEGKKERTEERLKWNRAAAVEEQAAQVHQHCTLQRKERRKKEVKKEGRRKERKDRRKII